MKLKQLFCWHKYTKIRHTKGFPVFDVLFSTYIVEYGYGKCDKCGKGRRFTREGLMGMDRPPKWKRV